MPAWFAPKTRVLIFGTGAGGVSFYKRCRSRYNVVGFLDNNQQKQGQLLFNKTIHAPQKLNSLVFDKIIIVSDYYREIYQQLVSELAISEQKIGIFQETGQSTPSLRQRLGKRLELAGYERMCLRPGPVSDLLYWLFFRSHNKKQSGSTKRLPLRWLDGTDSYKVHVFRPPMPGKVQGPRFMDRDVLPKDITLPEVALYHFKDGQVCSVSRSIILPSEELVIERVTTSPSADADYSGANLLYHGKALALVRDSQPESIGKGILISGCNEVNYYHWVLEILPQLQFIAELPARYADYPILISAFSQNIPSIKALMEGMGIDRQFIFLTNIISYRVADLLLISAPNNLIPNRKYTAWSLAEDGFARRESIMFLREKALALAIAVPTDALPKRVFLARRGFLRLYNQSEILAMLEPHGFTCVYMEDQNFSHQAAIMANAEMIIGPTGAAWTNILFASKGAKALCWMAKEWGELSCFSNLAAIVGAEMDYISYQAGTSDSRELYYKEYVIDIGMINTWLQRHLAIATDEEKI